MADKKTNDSFEKYSAMDPEDRLYEARRRIRRMIAIRLALAALLVWIMFRFHLPIGVKILLAAVILMILLTAVPAFVVLRRELKDPEEE